MACKYLTRKKICRATLNSSKTPEKFAFYCSEESCVECPRYRFVQARSKSRG